MRSVPTACDPNTSMIWDSDVDMNSQTPLLEGNPFRCVFGDVFLKEIDERNIVRKKQIIIFLPLTYLNRPQKAMGGINVLRLCSLVEACSVGSSNRFKTMTNCKSIDSELNLRSISEINRFPS